MPELVVRTPVEEGAARIRLLTPAGQNVSDLNTPSDDQMRVPDAQFGDYQAIVEPIGGTPRYFSFSFGPQTGIVDLGGTHPDAHAPIAATTTAGMSVAEVQDAARPPAPTPASATMSAVPLVQASDDDPLFFLGRSSQPRKMEETRLPEVESVGGEGGGEGAVAAPDEVAPFSESASFAAPSRSAISAAEARAPLAIGLSHDDKPFDPGGWKPYRYQQLETRRLEEGDGAELVFNRRNSTLPAPAHARLRLMAIGSGSPAYRMLVPLFDGGVRVKIRQRAEDAAALDLEITPIDPDRLALSQALAAGAGGEGTTILAQFLRRNELFSYISDDAPQDPWTAIMAVLVGVRFAKLGPKEGAIVSDLASRYGWITDALILEARRLLAAPTSNWRELDSNRRKSLSTLKRARQVGAPYFFYSNAMVSDLLAALASRPSDMPIEERFDARVEDERRRWQRFIGWQGQAGAFFIWRSHRRRRTAHFDPRYTGAVEAN